MANVAQSVEHQFVALKVASSILVVRPFRVPKGEASLDTYNFVAGCCVCMGCGVQSC